jgi:hypothetical protein
MSLLEEFGKAVSGVGAFFGGLGTGAALGVLLEYPFSCHGGPIGFEECSNILGFTTDKDVVLVFITLTGLVFGGIGWVLQDIGKSAAARREQERHDAFARAHATQPATGPTRNHPSN